jgi:DNA-binding transcriptional ArsR family regulator
MMQKLSLFFNSLWKRKKMLVFALLIFVVVGISLPSHQPAMAAGGCSFNPITGNIDFTGCPGISTIIDSYYWFVFTVPQWKTYIIYYPIKFIADVLNSICYYIAKACGMLFIYVLNNITSNGAAITRNEVFTAAWYMIKNWAIMLIDVSLIAAALMIILRLWADKAKELLPQIIIVALLVNFSNVLVGLIYDASNFIMRALIGNTGGGNVSGLFLKINDAWNAIIWSFDVRAVQGFQNIMLYFSMQMLFGIMYLILAGAMLFFSFILVQRYVMIAILFILSPLAFALRIVPVEQGHSLFSSWWEHFLKYCFVGLGAAFFLRLATEVVGIYPWDHLADGDYTALLPLILHFGIVIMFLIFGIYLTKKGSPTVVDYTMKGLGLTWKVVGGVTGVKGVTERVVNSASDGLKYNRVTNFFRDLYGGTGASALAQKKEVGARLEVNDATERAEVITAAERRQIISGNAYTEEQRVFRAAAIKVAAKNGELKDLPIAEQQRLAEMAINDGVKSDEVIAHMSKEAQADAIRRGLFTAGTRAKIFKLLADKNELSVLSMAEQITALTEAAVNGIRPEDVVGKMSSATQAEIINDPALFNRLNPQARGKVVESLMKKGRLDLINENRRDQVYTNAVEDGTNIEDLEVADYRAASLNTNRVAKLSTQIAAANPTFTPAQVQAAAEQAARDEVLDDTIAKKNGDQLRDINSADLTFERIARLTPEKIRQFQSADGPVRSRIRGYIPTGLTPLTPVALTPGRALDDAILREQNLADNARLGFPPDFTAAQRAAGTPDPNLIDNPQSNIHRTEANRLMQIRRAIGSIQP